jgi:hypothetical protein
MIYKRASEIVPRPFDEARHLFLSHPVDDEEGCVELLEELLTYFQPDEPAPPPSIWAQTVSLLINNGLLHPSPEIRCISVDKLCATKSNMVINPLLRLLGDSDENVRYCLQEEIYPPFFNEEQILPSGDVIPAWTQPGFELNHVLEPLMAGLQDENRLRRIWSSTILARNYRCVSAIPQMLELLHSDPDDWVRAQVADDLGSLSNEELDDHTRQRIISVLTHAKNHNSPIIRWGAARGLFQYAELTSVEATNIGVDLLSINNDQLTLSILWWCNNCGSQEAVQPIHDFIYQHNPTLIDEEVLHEACMALEALGAVDELINLLRATNRPKMNIVAAYELRFMEQLNQHEDRVAVAENVVQCLQSDDNFDDSDQVWLDEIRAVD